MSLVYKNIMNEGLETHTHIECVVCLTQRALVSKPQVTTECWINTNKSFCSGRQSVIYQNSKKGKMGRKREKVRERHVKRFLYMLMLVRRCLVYCIRI